MWIVIGIIALVFSLAGTHFTARRTTAVNESGGKEHWRKADMIKFLFDQRGVVSAPNAMALLMILPLLFTACAGSEEVKEDRTLQLTFDGESCTYEGPTELKPGPVTLLFRNESEGWAAVNLVRHTGDETIQDAIDYIGEEPSTVHHASWTKELGTWTQVRRGESYTWEGVLEPGIHHMVCASLTPSYGVWFGGGFTVED